MFCEESLERLNLQLFRNVSVHEFYRFKALITFEQVYTTELSKKIRILFTKTAMARCCKLPLYANVAFDEHEVYVRR